MSWFNRAWAVANTPISQLGGKPTTTYVVEPIEELPKPRKARKGLKRTRPGNYLAKRKARRIMVRESRRRNRR